MLRLVIKEARRFAVPNSLGDPRAGGRLIPTAGETRLELGEDHRSLSIGRAPQNDLVVPQQVVSRLHARLEYRGGRFVLTDVSANGTFVVPDDGESRHPHRESLDLTGSGMFTLGEATAADSPFIVRYARA